MSAGAARPPSPAPSISLLEIKAETRLVLKSFLRHSLAIPLNERPGRIGGAYKDPSKYSVNDQSRRGENGWDSLDEEISMAEEKKHSFKDLIKRRLRPRPTTTRRAPKDGSTDQPKSGSLENDCRPSQSDKERSIKNDRHSLPRLLQDRLEDEVLTPSSTSEEEGERKRGEEKKKKKNKKKKKIKLKTQISEIFKSFTIKKDEPHPPRPTTLPIKKGVEPEQPPVSPTHPPEFYDEVAETLDKIARRHSVKKSPMKPVAPPICPPAANDKDAVVQQLVQVLCMEGDAINRKINANPLLRNSLARLSYPSFAKLLDTYANQEVGAPLPAPVSPTLRRVASTMVMSRRVITATGTQRMQGYAERYMENFAPWVKSQGGWETIFQLEEVLEYD